ncbi:MAG: hypothetical protein JEY91_18015 [Spirochaetaceae bacterium]|nr:hypothetical protein [Spirochaetaceae bacterium]
MKKAFMLVAAIALLAAPVFAEVEVAISGDATTSFGYNLDLESYGLLSEVSSDITLTVGALDGESMGEGNWYGVIELTGASLKWNSGAEEGYGYWRYEWDEDLGDDGDWDAGEIVDEDYLVTTPDVAARITNGNVYVMLQSEADFDADYVAGVDNDPFEYSEPDDVAGSLTIGGTMAPATIAVEFATAGDYENDQIDGVVLGANLGLDLAPVTVDVAFAGAFGYEADQEIGIAVQVGASVAPATITAAFDGIILSGDFTYEAGLSVSLDLSPLTVGVDARYAEDDLDTKLTLGFANDMLTADVYVGLYDLTTDIAWEVGADLTVTINSGVAANAGASYSSAEILTAYADVSFTELVDNVTFTIGWENADDMLGNDVDETDLGDIYLSAGIAF